LKKKLSKNWWVEEENAGVIVLTSPEFSEADLKVVSLDSNSHAAFFKVQPGFYK
jgi:hypothetical protein